MKILSMFLILFLAFSASAFAGPFIVSDPSPDCTTCIYEVDGDTTAYPTEADGSIKHDLQTIAPGDHIYQFRYGKAWTADAIEGDAPYEFTEWTPPFHLNRPDMSGIPTGQKLSR